MDTISAQAQAQVQANLDAASANVKATVYAQTGVDLNNQRVQQGARSALSLLQNGYNPASDADSAQLIHAIAGGCALIPGGQIFGAYVELLWQAGNAAACPLENAFASIGMGSPSPACGGQACTRTGPPATAASVIASSELPANWNSLGSFSSLAVGALATYAAQNMNCKGGVPPGMVVDAVVTMWNQTHSDSASVLILVPPLALYGAGGSSVIIPFWQNVSNATTGNVDPYVYYAFQATAAIPSSFNVPTVEGEWNEAGMPAVAGTLFGSTAPRLVRINAGSLVDPSTGKAPKTTTVAGHAGAILGGGFVGGMMLAIATGRSANVVFDGAWNILQAWAKDALGAVEGGIKVSTGAAEGLSRRKRRRR